MTLAGNQQDITLFQLVGDETLPFSDSSVARNAIQRLTEGGEQK